MGNKKAREREKRRARKRMNKIMIGIVSAVVLVAVVATVGVEYKKNVEGKEYANNDVNEAGENGEIKTGSNGTNNENDLGIKLSNYVVAGSEEAKRSEEILKKAQEEREEEEKKEIEKNKEESKSTKYAGKSTVQLASNAESTRDIRGAVQEVATTDISSGILTLSQETYEYNGQRNTPDPTLIVDGEELILGKDYEITYTNNINAGTGTATVTGKNGYEGTISETFTINPMKIKVEWIDEQDQYVYDGTEHKPKVKTPIICANGDKINLKVVIKDDKQAIDAGTYTAVAEIESIEPGPVKEKPGDITVNHTITDKSNGTAIAVDSKVQKGTTLCIQITATQANGTIKSIYSDTDSKSSMTTATYSLEITENGIYGFAIVGSENTSTWYTVEVNNYVENQIPAGLEVGDYVSYTPDNGESTEWRVWEIDEGTGKVVITPVNGIGELEIENGANGWLNAEEAIETECDKYKSNSLGITANEVRSMKIEDIEKVMSAEKRRIGSEYSYTSGTFYAEKASETDDTFDGYNKVLTEPKSEVTLVETVWWDGNTSPTWNKLNNTKTGMMNDTYGTIFGDMHGWLASRAVICNPESNAFFVVRSVSNTYIGGYMVYNSLTSDPYNGLGTSNCTVHPLVTLSSTLFKTGGGTSNNPWQLAK